MSSNQEIEPKIIHNVLSEKDLKQIQKQVLLKWLNKPKYNEIFGKHHWTTTSELKFFHDKLLDLAREHFNNDKILPSFSSVSVYEGKNAKLRKHKDDNACTYHIDLCIFQKDPWSIFVQHNNKIKEYILNENDALLMSGTNNFHWRKDFPKPDTNLVINCFFFFVDPDHWWYTKGPEYINEIRGKNKQ